MNPEALFARTGLSIDRLRSFLVVAEAGGIASAAPRNPVRQSQLSRQLAELETFFGVALAERRGRGLALTAAGERLAIVVRETMQGLGDVATTNEDERIEIALGAGDSVLHGLVIPRIALPRTVTTSLVALAGPDVGAQIMDARLDFGIVRADDVPARARSRVLGSIAYALYVPRALHAPKKAPLELLATLPIATQYGDPELDERLATALRRAGTAIAPALVCETFPQAQRAVMSGRYAAILPTFARAELAPRSFDEHRTPIFGPPAKLHLVWHPRLEHRRPRAFGLVSALADALSIKGRSG